MNNLQKAVSIITSGRINGKDTIFIDETLLNTDASAIPVERIDNVLDYIDLQLANNPVSQVTKQELERLHGELKHRQCGA